MQSASHQPLLNDLETDAHVNMNISVQLIKQKQCSLAATTNLIHKPKTKVSALQFSYIAPTDPFHPLPLVDYL